jgi:hypothetical protein
MILSQEFASLWTIAAQRLASSLVGFVRQSLAGSAMAELVKIMNTNDIK